MIKKEDVFKLIAGKAKKNLYLIKQNPEGYLVNKYLDFVLDNEKEGIEHIVEIINKCQENNNLFINKNILRSGICKLIIGFREDYLKDDEINLIPVSKINDKWIANEIYNALTFKRKIDIEAKENILDFINPDEMWLKRNTNNDFILIESEIYPSESFKHLKIKTLKELLIEAKRIILEKSESHSSDYIESFENIWRIPSSTYSKEEVVKIQKISKIEKIIIKDIDCDKKIFIKHNLSTNNNFKNNKLIQKKAFHLTKNANISHQEMSGVYLKVLLNKIKGVVEGDVNDFIATHIIEILGEYLNKLKYNDSLDNLEKITEVLSAYKILNLAEIKVNVFEQVIFENFLKLYDTSLEKCVMDFIKEDSYFDPLLKYLNFTEKSSFNEDELVIDKNININMNNSFIALYIKDIDKIKYMKKIDDSRRSISLSLENISNLSDYEIKKIILDLIVDIPKDSTVDEFNRFFRQKKLFLSLDDKVDDKERNKKKL